jgi:hypothetical protein
MNLVRLIKMCLNETYNKVHIKVKLSLGFITQHHAMKACWGGGIALRILDMGTR